MKPANEAPPRGFPGQTVLPRGDFLNHGGRGGSRAAALYKK